MAGDHLFVGAIVFTLATTAAAAGLGYVVSELIEAYRNNEPPEYDPYYDDW